MSVTCISAATLDAYRQTLYRVWAEPAFVLSIGQYSLALARLHAEYGVASSAFITACNPQSRVLPPHENTLRQQALLEMVCENGWPSMAGVAQAASGSWPEEASLLVLGVGRQQACALAQSFEQNALVFCGAQCVPELVLLR